MNPRLFFSILFLFFLFNSKAQEINWASGHGGHVGDFVRASALDSEDNLIIGGYIHSGDFGDYMIANRGVYIAKYDTTGRVLWVFESDGEFDTRLDDIAVDNLDNTYAIGSYDHPPTIAGILLNPDHNTFMVKFDGDGNFEWVHTYPTSWFKSIFIDSTNNLFVAGDFHGTILFDTIPLQASSNSSRYRPDFFIARLDNSNGKAIWAKKGGGVGEDFVYKLTGDNQGSLYLAGAISSSIIVLDKEKIYMGGSSQTGFIIKWDTQGNYRWITHGAYISNSINEITDISVDKRGNINALGGYYGTHIVNNDTLKKADEVTAYMAKYDSTGVPIGARSFGAKIFRRYIPGHHMFGGITTDEENNIYVATVFNDSIQVDRFKHISNGDQDILVAKFNEVGYCQWTKHIGGSSAEYVDDIVLGRNKNLYVSGEYKSPYLNLDSLTISNNSGNNSEDIYLFSIRDTQTHIICSDVPIILKSDQEYFCENDSLKLFCGNQYIMSYLWENQDSVISSTYQNTLTVKDSGIYQLLTNRDFICEDSSNTVDIKIRSLPGASITSNPDTTYCLNDSFLLSVSYYPQYLYEWRFDEGSLVGDSNTLSVFNPGLYYSIIDDGFCLNTDSLEIVSAIPTANLKSSTFTILCPGKSLSLRAYYDSSYNYAWFRNDTLLKGDNATLKITEPGNYLYMVENGVCNNSDSIKIVKQEIPEIEILQDSIILSGEPVRIIPESEGASYFQWFMDGRSNPIAYAQEIQLFNEGRYFVFAYNHCGVDSDSVVLIDLSNQVAENLLEENVCFYPNPTNSFINVRIHTEQEKYSDLSLVSSDGRVIWIRILGTETDFSIDLSRYPTGTYYILMRKEKNTLIKKIIKN